MAVVRHMYGQSYWTPDTPANKDPRFHVQVYQLGVKLGVSTICNQAMDLILRVAYHDWEADRFVKAVKLAFTAETNHDPDQRLRRLMARLCHDRMATLTRCQKFKDLMRDPECVLLRTWTKEHIASRAAKGPRRGVLTMNQEQTGNQGRVRNALISSGNGARKEGEDQSESDTEEDLDHETELDEDTSPARRTQQPSPPRPPFSPSSPFVMPSASPMLPPSPPWSDDPSMVTKEISDEGLQDAFQCWMTNIE